MTASNSQFSSCVLPEYYASGYVVSSIPIDSDGNSPSVPSCEHGREFSFALHSYSLMLAMDFDIWDDLSFCALKKSVLVDLVVQVAHVMKSAAQMRYSIPTFYSELYSIVPGIILSRSLFNASGIHGPGGPIRYSMHEAFLKGSDPLNIVLGCRFKPRHAHYYGMVRDHAQVGAKTCLDMAFAHVRVDSSPTTAYVEGVVSSLSKDRLDLLPHSVALAIIRDGASEANHVVSCSVDVFTDILATVTSVVQAADVQSFPRSFPPYMNHGVIVDTFDSFLSVFPRGVPLYNGGDKVEVFGYLMSWVVSTSDTAYRRSTMVSYLASCQDRASSNQLEIVASKVVLDDFLTACDGSVNSLMPLALPFGSLAGSRRIPGVSGYLPIDVTEVCQIAQPSDPGKGFYSTLYDSMVVALRERYDSVSFPSFSLPRFGKFPGSKI